MQRKDVDSFYGSVFEADFAAIQYREGLTPDEVLGSKNYRENLDRESFWTASRLATIFPMVLSPTPSRRLSFRIVVYGVPHCQDSLRLKLR